MQATTDLNNSCTKHHTGTSASAPIAAAIIALTLEAKYVFVVHSSIEVLEMLCLLCSRNLSWRDIQHLVVLTANPEPIVDDDWIVNGDGFRVSLRFGFGIMDASLMVQLARLWRSVPPLHNCTFPTQKIDRLIQGSQTVTVLLSLSDDSCRSGSDVVRRLEKVHLYLDVDFSRRGGLLVVLESPAGTNSTLLPRRPNDDHSGPTKFHTWPLMSVQFWRERYSRGVWRLHLQVSFSTAILSILSSWIW